MELSHRERELVTGLQGGLSLTPHPYASIAESLGTTEQEVLTGIRDLQSRGVIKRVGVVVRHRALGYVENAMVVWDVPDEDVDVAGQWLGQQPGVNLCYRRPRCEPQWPYNLFCMIHGQARDQVRARIAGLRTHPLLEHAPYAVLFSTRCFKQCGARYDADGRQPERGDGA